MVTTVLSVSIVTLPAEESSEQPFSAAEAEEIAEATPVLPSLVPRKGEPSEISTPFENVKELKHLSEPDFQRFMGFITESLDVRCTFCHNFRDYSLDEKEHKIQARRMVAMIQYLNKDFFMENRVSCFTCHAGSSEPVRIPEDFPELPSLLTEGKEKRIPEDFTNVRRLQHLIEDQYNLVMDFFVASLGVWRCTFCHERMDYSADEKTHKLRAREMIGMVQHVNKNYFEKELLNCFVCHKGQQQPVFLPPKWEAESLRAREEGEE